MNYRIFTPRRITKGITPVSIKLKTTVRTDKARKIIRKAERDLLQARVKSINCLLDNNAKQRDLCRSQLATVISTTSMLKCQELIDKAREFRYLKGRERQISKFNRLLQKEGKITWSSTPNPNSHQPGSSIGPHGANPQSQPGRSAGSTCTQPQAVNANPQPGMSTCNANAHSQTGSANPPSARRKCRQGRHSLPDRLESQSKWRHLWCYSWGKPLLPWTIQQVSLGNKGQHPDDRCLCSLPS